MSRSGYLDDCENLELYRGTVNRSIRGRRGQAFIRELISALDAMPVKELAANLFVEESEGGKCCAMGAVALARGLPRERLAQFNDEYAAGAANLLGISNAMASEIAFENDGHEFWGTDKFTDEQRFEYMRSWATGNIVESSAPPKGQCSWCLREFTLQQGKIAWHKLHGVKCNGAGKDPKINAR